MCTISLKSRDCDVRWPPCYYSHSLDPIEAVRPWSTLFASVLELVDYIYMYVSKQTTSVDVIFQIHCMYVTMADSLSRALTGSEPFIGKVPL